MVRKDNDIASEGLSREDEEKSGEIADVYGIGSHSYTPMSTETFVLVVVLAGLLIVVINSFFVQPQLTIIPNGTSIGVSNISNGTVGNLTMLKPGTAAYNQARSEMQSSLDQQYYQQLSEIRQGEFIFLILMFAGFFYSYRYVMTSTKKSWIIYLFITTSFFGWGSLIGIVSLIMGVNVVIGIFGGLGGLYYAYWKLQDRGFI